ncbi:XkdX family protein [Anoxybacillus geothermalis]|nr:XkdX family protein [Anoxybacillus geothermalis]
MAVYTFLVRAYARDIYLYGNRRFSDILPEYVEPVKQYAAQTFTQEQIDNALAQGWITQTEYEETMAYKTAQ